MGKKVALWSLPNLNKVPKDSHEPNEAMTLPEEDLYAELKRRESENVFPIDVFPPQLTPWLNFLLVGFRAEPSFVGTALLQAGSVAIGSGLRCRMSTMTEKLSIYSALVGYTSSGKSVVIDNMFEPIKEIQNRLDEENEELERSREGHEDFSKKAIITEDTTFGSFVDMLSQNPKGVSKVYDELSTFFDDMERFKSVNAGEDKFWLKAWNSRADHKQSRKGKISVNIPRETFFCNIFGGTQPIFLKLFFEKTRYESGFSSRFIFALQPKYEIMEIDPYLEFPTEAYDLYRKMIQSMYDTYKVVKHGWKPEEVYFTKQAIDVYQIWSKRHLAKVKAEKDDMVKNAKAGIYGKMKQYVVRFAGILKVMYKSCEDADYCRFEKIEPEYVRLACKLADYYMDANYTAYEIVYKNLIVPPEIVEFVGACKAHNWNITKVAEAYGHTRVTIRSRMRSYSKEYPHLFFSKG
jgi:hypothetical protein